MFPFLRNAWQIFQRFIFQLVPGLFCVYASVDDLLVASENHTEHFTKVRTQF